MTSPIIIKVDRNPAHSDHVVMTLLTCDGDGARTRILAVRLRADALVHALWNMDNDAQPSVPAELVR